MADEISTQDYYSMAHWAEKEPKPEHYAEVVELVERIGVPAILRALGHLGNIRYSQALDKRLRQEREREEAAKEKLRGSHQAITEVRLLEAVNGRSRQIDRESYVWMYTAQLKDEAARFENRVRLAGMTDEEVAAEERDKKISDLERELERERSKP